MAGQRTQATWQAEYYEIQLSLKLEGRPFFGKNFPVFLCTFFLKELSHGFYMPNVELS